MARAAERTLISEDEYIELERRSETKNELLHGEIIAMAGGSPRHSAISANVIRLLGNVAVERRCIVFTSDQRVHIESTGLYTYADITVTCDRPRFHQKFKDTLLNPQIIVEILSDSTEAYDRGAKFAHFRTLPSLREYILVSQDYPRVEHYLRLETGQWTLTAYDGEAAIAKLPSLDCELPLAAIYYNVTWLDPEDTPAESP